MALIVDDDADTVDAIAKLLRSIGHECRTASTVEKAREVLDGEELCYVVTDQQMVAAEGDAPDVGVGMAFLRHARSRFPTKNSEGNHVLQILAMSAHLRTPSDGVKTIRYGADDFIEKPFTSDDFLRAVEEMIARSGRTSHERGCVSRAAAGAPHSIVVESATGSRVILEVPGAFEDGKSVIRLGSLSIALGGASLYVLLRLVEGRLRSENEWVPVDQLGGRPGSGFNGVSRLDSEILSGGWKLKVHQNLPGAGWRLAPGVELGDVNTAALRVHPEPRVKNLAEELERLVHGSKEARSVPAKRRSR